jgi:hypothetical protein
VELPDSIEPDQLKTAAIAVIVVLALLAFVVMRFIQKMVLRVIMLGVLVAGGLFLYAQRDDLDECQRRVRSPNPFVPQDERCTCDFAGFEVKVPGCAAIAPGQDG